MEQLARLKARIANLDDLGGLMRAMRALAASHVQEAQSALKGIRQYAAVIEDAIAQGVTLLPVAATPAPVGRDSEDILVLICSEHGFVGGFNERLVDRALENLGPDRRLAIVGRRGVDLAGERGVALGWCEAMATQVRGVPGVARRIADRLAGAGRVDVIFGGYRRGGNYELELRRLLPLDPALLERANGRSPPLHHLPPQVLLQRLAGEYLVAEISRALMESIASENGARLQVMEAADRNIDDRLQHLGMQARSLRQEAITAELLDLITGAEAILTSAD